MSHDPVRLVIDGLTRGGWEPVEAAKGWESFCPVHEHNRSHRNLYIREGTKGVVFHCHACGKGAHDKIAAALGLELTSLFFDAPRPANPKKPEKPRTAHPTLGKAIKAALWAINQRDKTNRFAFRDKWEYPAIDGSCWWTIRFDAQPREDGEKPPKQFSPIFQADGKFFVGLPCETGLPLYGSHRIGPLSPDEPVYVVEGEKCVDALAKIGVWAVSPFGGAKNPHKSDWTPLGGRDVIAWPDNDEPGQEFADAVTGILAALPTPPRSVRRLDHTKFGLGPKGDAADFVADRLGFGAADLAILRELDNAVFAAHEIHLASLRPAQPEPQVDINEAWDDLSDIKPTFEEFPVDRFFPSPVAAFVREVAKGTATPPDVAAIAAIVAAAGAIGASYQVSPNQGTWVEPCILYAALIATPGKRKSPAFKAIFKPIIEIDGELRRRNEREFAEWSASTKGRKEAQTSLPPPRTALVINSATMEAVHVLLRDNPKGLVGYYDELAAWVGGFDQYRSKGKGAGTDKSAFMSLWSATPINIDRKSFSTHISRPNINIAGCLCPDDISSLAKGGGGTAKNDGFFDRILVVYPDPSAWPVQTLDNAIMPSSPNLIAWDAAIRKLHDLPANIENGTPQPKTLCFSDNDQAEARRRANELYQEISEDDIHSDREGPRSKLANCVFRLAMVRRLLRWATDEPEHAPPPSCITLDDFLAARELYGYFDENAMKVMGFNSAAKPGDAAKVIALLKKRELKEFTDRELGQWFRQLRQPRPRENVINWLANNGYIQAKTADAAKSGRPKGPTWLVNPSIHSPKNNLPSDSNSIGEERKTWIY